MALQLGDSGILEPPIDQYISPKTIAERLKVSPDTVLRMARKGDFEGVEFGGQVRILYSSSLDYMEKHKIQKSKVS